MKRRNLGLTSGQFDAAFAHWVRALHLDHWHITCAFMQDIPALDGAEKTQGEATPDFVNGTANILIRPRDLWPYPKTPHDVEQCLVHELLHCRLDRIWVELEQGSMLQKELHSFIDEEAWRLVDTRRGGPLLVGDPDPEYIRSHEQQAAPATGCTVRKRRQKADSGNK